MDSWLDPRHYLDHYQRKGDGPCAFRQPSGHFHSPSPPDADIQCRTCRFAKLCFEADGGEPAAFGSDVIEELDDCDVPYVDPEDLDDEA